MASASRLAGVTATIVLLVPHAGSIGSMVVLVWTGCGATRRVISMRKAMSVNKRAIAST